MSPFKKWPCPLSLFFKVSCQLILLVKFRLSIFRNGNVSCRCFMMFLSIQKIVQCCPTDLRKVCVALPNFTVKGSSYLIVTMATQQGQGRDGLGFVKGGGQQL